MKPCDWLISLVVGVSKIIFVFFAIWDGWMENVSEDFNAEKNVCNNYFQKNVTYTIFMLFDRQISLIVKHSTLYLLHLNYSDVFIIQHYTESRSNKFSLQFTLR